MRMGIDRIDAPAIWNAVLDKASEAGVASLSAREKEIYHLNRLVVELENGGLTGLLYNMSPGTGESGWSELHATIAALQSAGETKAALVLGRIAATVESLPRGSAGTWGDWIAPAESRLSQLESELDIATARVWEKLEVLADQLPKEKPQQGGPVQPGNADEIR